MSDFGYVAEMRAFTRKCSLPGTADSRTPAGPSSNRITCAAAAAGGADSRAPRGRWGHTTSVARPPGRVGVWRLGNGRAHVRAL
jgi:hypothetical protein